MHLNGLLQNLKFSIFLNELGVFNGCRDKTRTCDLRVIGLHNIFC